MNYFPELQGCSPGGDRDFDRECANLLGKGNLGSCGCIVYVWGASAVAYGPGKGAPRLGTHSRKTTSVTVQCGNML